MLRGVDTAAALSSRWLLVKCQDQVVSGRKFWQTDRLTTHLDEQGWRKVDQLLVAGYMPQPLGRRQVHARQDFSSLLVVEDRLGPLVAACDLTVLDGFV
jgi:hypothetical protein